MSIVLIAVLLAWVGIFGLGFHSPGAGLALAAVLGRYEFPLRGDSALFVAAPALLILALVGILAGRKKQAFMKAPEMPMAIVAFSCFGAFTTLYQGNLNPLGFERLMMLVTYVLPLSILASSLTAEQLAEFRIWLVRTATALAAIALVVGSVDHSGRAAALGGGPIPLAQLCMFGLLVVSLFDDDYIPGLANTSGRILARVSLGLLLLGAGLQTASRFPLMAVAIAVLLLATNRLLGRGIVSGYLRSRWKQAAVVMLVSLPVAYGARSLVNDQVSSRFGLLTTNFLGEFKRSRGELFEYSWSQAITSLPTGHGPGNFLEFYFTGSEKAIIYPHNILLEVLGDYGLPGLVVLVLVLRKLFFSQDNIECDARYLLLGYYALAISFSSGDLVHNRYFFLFGTLILVSRARPAAVLADEADESAIVPRTALAKA